MNAKRRILVSATAGVLLTVVGTTTARASYSDSVTGDSYSVSTATIPAPGSVTGSLSCLWYWAAPSVTWTPSTARNVSGYLVTIRFSDGRTQTVQKSASSTSWNSIMNIDDVTSSSIRYSVTTQTTYGWTAESAKTGWFGC